MPIIPDQVVNVALGVSNIRFRDFFIVTLIGFIPKTIIYVMFGRALFLIIGESGFLIGMVAIFLLIVLYPYRKKFL